jgi:exosortase A-associated hydrolase 2
MINIKVEFFKASHGNIFRLIRTPVDVRAHIIYLTPLFEQANQTRHMHTRLSLNAYQLGVESIVFDHYGSGDSSGDLVEASLFIWQQDILQQIKLLRTISTKPIFISSLLSSALLLTEEIISLSQGLILAQPEFNGKRFMQQFKRLALVSNMTSSDVKTDVMNSYIEKEQIEIAGYILQKSLFDDLARQTINRISTTSLSDKKLPTYWLEWCNDEEELPLSRSKQQMYFSSKNEQVVCSSTDELKFWQSTELEISSKLVAFEQKSLLNLLSTLDTNKAVRKPERKNQVENYSIKKES